MGGTSPRRTNFLRAAILNVANLTVLTGVSVASVLTHQPWLLGAGVAFEAAWLALTPNNWRFQRAVKARLAGATRLDNLRQMQEQAALLPAEERSRVQLLGARAAEVKSESLRNPRLPGDFMIEQLEKLDDVVAEYIHLAVTAHRCDAYLNRADTKQLNRERETWQRASEDTSDPAAHELAKQNVTVVEKRIAIVDEMARFIVRARAQMALIQHTVALLRDQVMTMATPEALSLQLDELVIRVEAVRDSVREVESVVSGQPRVGESSVVAPPRVERTPEHQPPPTDRVRQ